MAFPPFRADEPRPQYRPNPQRYATMQYRTVGASGLQLPLLSLGLWHNFGNITTRGHQQAILRAAFDSGITHFDLANNYGPPFGAAEENFGLHLRTDFAAHRDELIISTKAGHDMWAGPYGIGGSRKYLVASLDQSLARMGLDYVDIFYHHTPSDVPLEETMLALHHLVQQGKALYVGVSSYSAAQTLAAQAIAREIGTPLIIHQPSYNLLNRGIEEPDESGMRLLDATAASGMGVIGFWALQQGLLTNKYLAGGIPSGSRSTHYEPFAKHITEANLAKVRALNEVAAKRGQSLAQMALAWVLRDQGEGRTLVSTVIGVSSPEQLADNLGALANLDFSEQELQRIDAITRQP